MLSPGETRRRARGNGLVAVIAGAGIMIKGVIDVSTHAAHAFRTLGVGALFLVIGLLVRRSGREP